MKNNRQMLSSILMSTQMGQAGIRNILGSSMRPGLRKALESQMQEYESLEAEIHAVATERGWELKELQPGKLVAGNMMSHMKLGFGNIDSKIAALMIQRNTKEMIHNLRNLHQFAGQDSQVKALSQKLLDCESANIRQMQLYL